MLRAPRVILLLGCWLALGAAAVASPPTTSPGPTARGHVGVTPGSDAHGRPALRVFASRHYHIHTDLSRDATVPFGRHMDATYDQFARRFAAYSPRSDEAMPLYLFRHRDDYLAFMADQGIAARGTGGMFFVTRDAQGLATWTDGRSPEQTLRVLQHEGFHQFAWRSFGRGLPVWVNEGLAQYFEDAVILDRGMELGLADAHRIAIVGSALAGGDALPLDRLLSLSPDDWMRTLRDNPEKAQLLYAQSWSVVYYLIHGDGAGYLASFEVYLRQLSEGRDPTGAFDLAFGRGAGRALEDRWRRHAAGQRPDAVTLAADRLDFLATALLYKAQRGEAHPRTLAQLRADLEARQFTLTRSTHNLTRQLEAADPSVFTYTRPGGETSPFILLEPSGLGLPPRLVAPGLSPEPNVEWSRRDDGTLAYRIAYR